MSLIVTLHWVLGLAIVACAAILSWRYTGRRIALYLLTAQILLGAWLISTGLRPPMAHWLLAVAAWVLYMGANAATKRAPQSRLSLILSVVALLAIVATFGIGSAAWKHMAH